MTKGKIVYSDLGEGTGVRVYDQFRTGDVIRLESCTSIVYEITVIDPKKATGIVQANGGYLKKPRTCKVDSSFVKFWINRWEKQKRTIIVGGFLLLKSIDEEAQETIAFEVRAIEVFRPELNSAVLSTCATPSDQI